MFRRMYSVVRDLHLYFGLFLSPLVLIFAISVVFLVHAWIPGTRSESRKRIVTGIVAPAGWEQLKGREQFAAARVLLEQAGVNGEIGFVRQFLADGRVVIQVNVPGADSTFDFSTTTRTATVTTRTTGAWDAMVFLHKMPGPHNVAIRGNSVFLQVWRIFADATVYLILFLTLSGVYLWVVLRTERRVGLVFLAAGLCSFGGLIYALVA